VNRAALDRATAALEPPFAVVDLDAFDANAADLLRRAGATALRLASKSVRCRALQRGVLDAGFRGQLCFTLPEALWLADQGFDDLVVAYATADRAGYPASGAAGADRLPRPVLPAGLRLDRSEGAGEVQTPVLGPGARDLALGDRVWFRHAKAGELCERFASLHLVRGAEIVDEVATYRGEGQTFL
jgi:D-serine deaminase-like pyridoxal phosphate-dependent protein